MHQEHWYCYDNYTADSDATRMHRMYLKQARLVERGDVTLITTFIELGDLMSYYYRRAGNFRRKELSEKAIINMHEAMFDLPEGYYKEPKHHPLESSGVYNDEAWPSGKEEPIRRSAIMQARAQGPPDWVAGQEGDTITCKEVTVRMDTSLPILEGCLTGNSGYM